MKKNNTGFTMLELIMVVVIIGVLAALAVPQYALFVEKARAAEAINYIGAIKNAQISFIAGNALGYGAPQIATLGMLASTALWNYSTVYAPVPLFKGIIIASAIRTSGNYNGLDISMVYYNINGKHNWSGDHPGTPKD